MYQNITSHTINKPNDKLLLNLEVPEEASCKLNSEIGSTREEKKLDSDIAECEILQV